MKKSSNVKLPDFKTYLRLKWITLHDSDMGFMPDHVFELEKDGYCKIAWTAGEYDVFLTDLGASVLMAFDQRIEPEKIERLD